MGRTMNITVSRLFLSSLSSASPFLSVSSSSSSSVFKSIKFQNSFAPFVYSEQFRPKITVLSSKFTNITNSAIRIASSNVFNQSVPNTVQYLTQGILNIENCIFAKLHSEKCGGAIFATNSNLEMVVKNSGFKLCYSHLTGGAINFEGCAFNMTNVCFLGCIAFDKGQSIDISRDTKCNSSMKSFINYSSFMQCGPTRNKGYGNVLFIHHGEQSIYHINESANHVSGIGACLCVAHNPVLKLAYSTFGYSSGLNFFWFHGLTQADVLTQCNVLSNVAVEKGNFASLFAFENSHVTFNGFTFIGNSAKIYFMQGNLQLNGCVFDKKLASNMFLQCQYSTKDCFLNAINAKTRPILLLQTWECWAMGSPKPTPSRSMISDVDFLMLQTTPGATCMFALLLVGIISGVFGFLLIGKPKDVIASDPKFEPLEPGEME